MKKSELRSGLLVKKAGRVYILAATEEIADSPGEYGERIWEQTWGLWSPISWSCGEPADQSYGEDFDLRNLTSLKRLVKDYN